MLYIYRDITSRQAIRGYYGVHLPTGHAASQILPHICRPIALIFRDDQHETARQGSEATELNGTPLMLLAARPNPRHLHGSRSASAQLPGDLPGLLRNISITEYQAAPMFDPCLLGCRGTN